MKKQGFTLFIALTITATLLLVATGIVTVALRQSFLTGSSRESQYAFYAADSGIECAIYWDVKNESGFTAFATDKQSSIACNVDSYNQINPIPQTVGGAETSTFTLNFQPKPYCAVVTVIKSSDGKTNITSNGFNTCDDQNPRRAERSVHVSY